MRRDPYTTPEEETQRGRACFNRSKMPVSQNCCLWIRFGSRLIVIQNKTFSWTWCKSCDSSEAPSVAAEHHMGCSSLTCMFSPCRSGCFRISLCSSAKHFDVNDAHFSACHFYPHLHWTCCNFVQYFQENCHWGTYVTKRENDQCLDGLHVQFLQFLCF